MNDEIFEDCKNNYEKNIGKNVSYWGGLADKYNYESKDAIRGAWRREAEKRGYKRDSAFRSLGGPKILIYDIETSPLVCYSFSLYPERISTDQIIKDWHMISYSAKWLFDEEILSEVLTPKEMKNADDKRLAKSLWKLFDEADIIIGYNGLRFDLPRCNSRFLIHGLLPPSHFIFIDPIVTAKKTFGFSSNKMDYLLELLELDRKIHTDFTLWSRCMDGELEALEEMRTYNVKDSRVLESLYLELLPWIQSHPNMNLYYEDDVSRCPNCGSENLKKNTGTYKTLTNIYPAFLCNDCGYRGRERKGILSKEKSKTVVR